MKKLITGLLSSFAVVLLMVPMAHAQTPDGETPAEETVCDPLKVDGITKGLYGLCVAFCEAQDHAALSDAITDAELEALEADAPSGRILDSYNRKIAKAANGIDPPMPCILTATESCPCWTAEELDSIDGYYPLGVSLPTFECPVTDNITRQIRENGEQGAGLLKFAVANASTTNNAEVNCLYLDLQQATPLIRSRGFNAGTLTLPEAEECLAQVNAACLERGL